MSGPLMDAAKPTWGEAFDRWSLGEPGCYWDLSSQLASPQGPLFYVFHLSAPSPELGKTLVWFETIMSHIDLLNEKHVDALVKRAFDGVRQARTQLLGPGLGLN